MDDIYDDDDDYHSGENLTDYGSTLWGQNRALLDAVLSSDIESAQRAIDAGADINARGQQELTILQSAAIRCSDTIVSFLLSRGADVNARGGFPYGTALGAAAHRHDDNTSTLQLLLDHGADPNDGVDANIPCEFGSFLPGPPLHAAAEGMKPAAVKLLLQRGARVNAPGGMYGNALQAACHYGYEPTVRVLLEAGADVNLKGGYHGTALQAAARYGRIELTQLLLDAGADPTVQGGACGSALNGAVERGHPHVARMLEGAIERWNQSHLHS